MRVILVAVCVSLTVQYNTRGTGEKVVNNSERIGGIRDHSDPHPTSLQGRSMPSKVSFASPPLTEQQGKNTSNHKSRPRGIDMRPVKRDKPVDDNPTFPTANTTGDAILKEQRRTEGGQSRAGRRENGRPWSLNETKQEMERKRTNMRHISKSNSKLEGFENNGKKSSTEKDKINEPQRSGKNDTFWILNGETYELEKNKRKEIERSERLVNGIQTHWSVNKKENAIEKNLKKKVDEKSRSNRYGLRGDKYWRQILTSRLLQQGNTTSANTGNDNASTHLSIEHRSEG